MTSSKKRKTEQIIQQFEARIVTYVLETLRAESEEKLLEATNQLKRSIWDVLLIKHDQLEVSFGIPKKMIELIADGRLPDIGDALCYLWGEDGCFRNETSTMRLLDRFNKFTLLIRVKNRRITAHYANSKSELLPAVRSLRRAMIHEIADKIWEKNFEKINKEEPAIFEIEWQNENSAQANVCIYQIGEKTIKCAY